MGQITASCTGYAPAASTMHKSVPSVFFATSRYLKAGSTIIITVGGTPDMAWAVLRRKAKGERCYRCDTRILKGSEIVTYYGICMDSRYYHNLCARMSGMKTMRYRRTRNSNDTGYYPAEQGAVDV